MRPAPKFTSGVTAIIVVVLVILSLAIGAGALFGYQKYLKEQPELSKEEDSKIAKLESPTASPADKTTNWKTYTSTDGTFNFKYPPDWEVDDKTSQNLVGVYPKSRKVYETSEGTISIFKVANPKNFTVDQIIHSTEQLVCCLTQYSNSLLEKSETVKISGKNANRYYLKEGLGQTTDETYLLYNGYIYNFENNGGVNFRSTYNQILSTFKFE